MILQVSLEGFQSHVNTMFNLGSGLNVITGPSDAGKTAIIRAIRWVAFNEPQGEAFVNEVVGSAEVKIYLENNAIITKTRKKSKTSYRIQTDENDEGSIFEKSEVPLEVTNLLGIENHSFGDFKSALNFSFQLDAPFLISETASAGAKVLGKLADTESVDLAIKGVSKDTYAARNQRTQAEKDMERIVGSLFEYEGIDDAKQSLETAEMILEQVEFSKSKFDSLKEYRHAFQLAREKIQKLFETLDKLSHVPALEEDLKTIEKSQQRYDSLLRLYSDCNRLQERINVLGQELVAYEDVNIATDLVNSIDKDADRLANNIILRQSYQKYTDDVKISLNVLDKTNELDTAADKLSTAKNVINKLTELRSLKFEYQNMQERLKTADSRLDQFDDLTTADEYLNALASDVDRFAALKRLYQEFNLSFTNADSAMNEEARASNNVQKAELELRTAWDEAGGVCPLCETAVGDCHHE